MRKLIFISLGFIALSFLSCTSRPVRKVALQSQQDSVSYAMAFMTGYLHGSVYMDTTGEGIAEYIVAYDRGYNDAAHVSTDSTPQWNIKGYEHPYMASRGYRLGVNSNHWVRIGYIQQVPITLSQPIFRQGLINGLYRDTTMMTMAQANTYMRATRPDLFK